MRKIIYGPPGCGKTTALLNEIKHLKESGTPLDKIGLFTFTRVAADEALSRLGLRKSKNVRTLHSLAYEVCGISKEQMMDDPKMGEFSEFIGYQISGKTSQDPGCQSMGDQLLELHNLSKVLMVSIQETWDVHRPDVDPAICLMFSESYSTWKSAFGYVDFNDILEMAAKIKPDLGFSNLFVDEAQDLSPLQWSVVDAISGNVPNVVLAGDDDQAIFTWAGADAHGMSRRHAGAEVEVLSQSHRIPAKVHRLAQSISSMISQRVEKVYAPRQESGSLASWGSLRYVEPPKGRDTFVLYRNHTTRVEVEDWLTENYEPYTVCGSGLSSAFEDRYANSVRIYLKIKDGQEITIPQMGLLKRMMRPCYRGLDGPPSKMVEIPWWDLLEIPHQRAEYLSKVDLFSKPKVKISTIHSAKGAEADRVILMNEMGTRTFESMGDDEYRVWYVAVTRAKHTLDVVQGDNPFDLPIVECQ